MAPGDFDIPHCNCRNNLFYPPLTADGLDPGVFDSTYQTWDSNPIRRYEFEDLKREVSELKEKLEALLTKTENKVIIREE